MRTFLSAALLAVFASAASARTLEVRDILSLESVDRFSIAPDGGAIAYVHTRPQATERRYQENAGGGGLARGDVWVIRTGTSLPRNLTQGGNDGSGWFYPSWSSDGRYLAMASTRNTEGVHLYLWDTRSDGLRVLVSQSIDPSSTRWLNDEYLLAVVLGNDEPWDRLAPSKDAARAAMREWQRHWRGQATASVLTSGEPESLVMRRQDALVKVRADGSTHTLVSGVDLRVAGLSTDRRRVAVLRAKGVIQPDPAQPLPFRYRQSQYDVTLAVVDVVSGRVAVLPDSVQHVDERTVVWSLDGRKLAFIANPKNAPMTQAALMYCEVPQRLGGTLKCPIIAEEVPGEAFGWHIEPTLMWNGESILFRIQPKANLALRPNLQRTDWYSFSTRRPTQTVTRQLKDVPARLVPVLPRSARTPASVVAVVNGQLVRLYADGSSAAMALAGGQRVRSIEWANAADDDKSTFVRNAVVLVEADRSAAPVRYFVDLDSGASTRMQCDAPSGARVAAASSAEKFVLVAKSDSGTFAWVKNGSGACTRVVSLNTFLADFDVGSAQSYSYETEAGAKVTGWVLLPPGHRTGQRHPAVMWVYPGRIVGATVPDEMRVDYPFAFINLQLYAARGYAVIVPSIPSDPTPPYRQLLGAILPALDGAIGLGVVDSERVAIAGHSAGGYTTCSVITQTDRFKAAIAMAGPGSFVSDYGTFSPEVRYGAYPHEDHYLGGGLETSFGGMGVGLNAPPWKEPQLYAQNSPVMHVDKVNTPLLMVHGDLDIVPIQTSEQFFSGLYRLGKRAQFVRYWGEGHNITGSANVMDLWEREYVWLARYLGAER